MAKNTLYITFDGLTDPLGQSQILPYVLFIAKSGYWVTVLSCEKPHALKAEGERIKSLIKDLPIDWKYIEYNESGNFLSRYGYIKQLSKLAFDISAEKKFSLTHCRSYLSALIGLKLKQKKQIPFLFDMRGFWADERIDGGIWKKSNPLHYFFYLFFKNKERKFIQEADAIVSLTNSAVKHLKTTLPTIQIENKTKVIPCCTNVDLFSRQHVSPANYPEGITDKDLLLIYTGSIGTWYYTKEMIDCVLAWKEIIPNIKLLILTKDQNELASILDHYSRSQKDIIRSLSVPFTKVPAYLALAKAAIYFIKPAFSKMASSPTRMAECWAMNLPIITNDGIGDNDLYFKERTGGVLISEFTKEAYKTAAHAFLKQLDQNLNYRDIALQNFDNKKGAATYLEIYDRLSS